MATEYHDEKKGTTEKVLSIKPIKINSVKIVEIEKTINVPVYKEVEYEKPIIKDKEYERPRPVDKEYEKPVIKEKEYEVKRPVFIDEEILVPVPIEKPYDIKIPVPVEEPYDLPVVSMKQVKEMAAEATMVLVKAQGMLKEINGFIEALRTTVSEIKINLPKEIKMPIIVEEEMIIKVPKLEYETRRVIGKIIAQEN